MSYDGSYREAPMGAGNGELDALLTEGVMTRRVFAWCIDVMLIGLLVAALWVALAVFGVMTLGLGLPLLGVLPLVPFLYHTLFLAGPGAATPGQAMCGLMVVRDADLGPPGLLRAGVSTLAFYVTLATSGLLLVVALFTPRHRTLHDLLSGLVVVRSRALLPPPGGAADPWTLRAGYHGQ